MVLGDEDKKILGDALTEINGLTPDQISAITAAQLQMQLRDAKQFLQTFSPLLSPIATSHHPLVQALQPTRVSLIVIYLYWCSLADVNTRAF